jgi:calcium channel MID1
VIYDLSFCSQTAYAVPGNPSNFPNVTSLASWYDNSTQAKYQFFQNVLAQIPCETTASAQYSLVRTCDDCASAYKEWLCSVTMPRCTDFSSTFSWLQERNMGQPFPNNTMLSPELLSFANTSAAFNGSRNPDIDAIVAPGPYKEVLPCKDLCYNLVQSCPSVMGFACPQPGQLGFSTSYGQMPEASDPAQNNQITCNYPGAAYDLPSAGTRAPIPHISILFTLVVISFLCI